MKIAFYGSSLLSAYRNGAATYYRGVIRYLAALGHRITFYEPDDHGRRENRDLTEEPAWARVVVYPEGLDGVERVLDESKLADVVFKAGGLGSFDETLERELIARRRPNQLVIFWDLDATATLERLTANQGDPFRDLVRRYDLVFTSGGGDPVVHRYKNFGARECIVVYKALDPVTHHRVAPRREYEADLAFLGNRLPDREARAEEFFLRPASLLSESRFLLGGDGWQDRPAPPSVRSIGHVSTANHNAFNSTPRALLNVTRERAAVNGWCPPARLFETAGAAACLITDAWEGLEFFLDPGYEVLVARDGSDVAEIVRSLDERRAGAIGKAALRRVLAQHTYAHRAAQIDAILAGRSEPRNAAARERSAGQFRMTYPPPE